MLLHVTSLTCGSLIRFQTSLTQYMTHPRAPEAAATHGSTHVSFLLPHRAFFWLVSLLLASLIWFISVHLSDPEDSKLQYGLLVFGAAVSVLLQEAFRFAYFKLLK